MASPHAHHSHQHHDGHSSHQAGGGGGDGEGDTFTNLNRKHWDKAASTYSSEQWQKDFVNRTHEFILSNLEWIGVRFLDPSVAFEGEGERVVGAESPSRRVRVLDYACGPGTITGILHGYASEFVGVDVSEVMVKTYNEKFAVAEQEQQQQRTPTAKAYVGDLLQGQGPSESVAGPEFFGFDLAVVGYGFHHFEDLDVATARLTSRLKPGGVLMIVDFVTHAKFEGGTVDDRGIIAHHGFGEEEVEAIFGRAGLVEVAVLEMGVEVELMRPGRDGGFGAPVKRKVFLGRGRKPV